MYCGCVSVLRASAVCGVRWVRDIAETRTWLCLYLTWRLDLFHICRQQPKVPTAAVKLWPTAAKRSSTRSEFTGQNVENCTTQQHAVPSFTASRTLYWSVPSVVHIVHCITDIILVCSVCCLHCSLHHPLYTGLFRLLSTLFTASWTLYWSVPPVVYIVHCITDFILVCSICCLHAQLLLYVCRCCYDGCWSRCVKVA